MREFRDLVDIIAPVVRGEPSGPRAIPPGVAERASRDGVEGLLAEAAGPDYPSLLLAVHELDSRRCLAELARLEKHFAEEGQQVLVLKGGALLTTIYRGRPSWRRVGDLDLLPRDYPAALALLRRLGYTDGPQGLARNGMLVDLHRDVLGAIRVPARGRVWRFSAERLWVESLPLREGDRALRRLASELQFVHLAVHGLKHACDHLMWVVDMALLWPACQPARVHELAGECGAEQAVRVSLELLHRLWGVAVGPLPSPTLWERLYLAAAQRGRQPRWSGEILTVLSLPRWTDRLAYLRDLVAAWWRR